jgi:hypothetical protein
MIRLLALSTSALLLAAGCGKNDNPAPRDDCQLEKLDLSPCDRSGLGAIQADGIWNMNLTFSDGEQSPGVIRFVGEPSVSGLRISEKRVEPELFLLTSEETIGNLPRSYLFAGCRSLSPTHVEGVLRRCTNGATDLEGSFEARRIIRRASEAEASGVELVREVALPKEGTKEWTPWDVFVEGGYAYVTGTFEEEAGGALKLGTGIFIYALQPVEGAEGPLKVTKVAQMELPDDTWHQVWARGDTLYIASSKRGVLLYDISKRAEPRALKSFPPTAVDVRALSFDGNWLYAASPLPNAEILIFDATNPRELVLAKRYFVEQSSPDVGDRPYDVLARDGRLYVSHWSYGLTVSDVANPRQPKLLGRFSYSLSTTRTAAVGVMGGRTLAFEAGENWGAHLRVLDVSAPEIITQVANFQLRPEVSIRALALSGTKLYLAHYQDGLRVLDISNPNEPRQVGYYNAWRESDSGRGVSFFEGLSDVAVPGDGYVYATETSRGLLILREQ